MKTTIVTCDRCGSVCDEGKIIRYTLRSLRLNRPVLAGAPSSFDLCLDNCLEELQQYLEYAGAAGRHS